MASSSMLLLWCVMMMMMMMMICVCNSEVVVLPLTHSNKNTNISIQGLLKTSRARFHLRRQVSLPLSPGSDYTLTLTIPTTPPQSVSLYMDTGSDLVWFPCSPFECILCEGKPEAPTRPPNITAPSVSCQSTACSAAHSNAATSDLCAASGCPLDSIEISDCESFQCPRFYYAYADGSLIAALHRHTLQASQALPLPNFTFGCAHSTLAEPIGVAGFGRGQLSLPAQLSPHLGHHFSYCLVSHSFSSAALRRPSPLILGRQTNYSESFVYTPLLNNPKHPYFYSVALLGVSVGKSRVPAPDFLRRVDAKGRGGMVVDSGTTFTMLPGRFYEKVAEAFNRRMGRERAREIEDTTGLRQCYYYKHNVVSVPSLTLHLDGGDVALPRRNYMYELMDKARKRKVGCLMLINVEDDEESSGPGATLGNYQQQGFEVVYDLENERVGFAKKKCSQLWGHSFNTNHHR